MKTFNHMSESGGFIKCTLLSIDAWADCEPKSWYWNCWYTLEEGILLHESVLTARHILKSLRDWGYLTEDSKGKLTIEDDGYNVVIMDRKTFEPLLALDYGSNWEFND